MSGFVAPRSAGGELVNTHLPHDRHIQLWKEPHRAFEGQTTARQTYVPHLYAEPSVPADSARRTSIPLSQSSHFYGETTSKSAYREPPASALAREVTETKAYEPNRAKFYGETTNAAAYRFQSATPAEPSESARRSSIAINSGGDKFYGETTNRSTYRSHPGAERPQPGPRDQRSLQGVLDTGVNDFHTTSAATFVPHPAQPRFVAAPIKYEPNKAYFYGSTTSADTYQAWDVPKPERAHGPAQTAPSGRFYGETTSRQTFQGWQLPKQRLSLGLETVNDGFFAMIPKHQALPTRFSQVFTTVTDNQDSVEIVVRQGESRQASQNSRLGSFELVGLPQGPVGHVQIEVIFIVNEDGVLHVDARDKITGRVQHIAIDRTTNVAAFG